MCGLYRRELQIETQASPGQSRAARSSRPIRIDPTRPFTSPRCIRCQPRTDPTTDHVTDETGSLNAPVSLAIALPEATTDYEDSTPSAGAGPELRHERFRIGALLGEGGMGVVYRARATSAMAARWRSSP